MQSAEAHHKEPYVDRCKSHKLSDWRCCCKMCHPQETHWPAISMGASKDACRPAYMMDLLIVSLVADKIIDNLMVRIIS